MKPNQPPNDVTTVPATFSIGQHAVVLALQQRRWAVSVDGSPLASTYTTQAEAWEAGVREADRLDRQRG